MNKKDYRVLIYHRTGKRKGRQVLESRHVYRVVRIEPESVPVPVLARPLFETLGCTPPLWTGFVHLLIHRGEVTFNKQNVPVYGLSFEAGTLPVYWVGIVPELMHMMNLYTQAVKVWAGSDYFEGSDPKAWVLAHPLRSQAADGLGRYVRQEVIDRFTEPVDRWLLPGDNDEVFIKSNRKPQTGRITSASHGFFGASQVSVDGGAVWISNYMLIPARLIRPSGRAVL